MRIRIAVLLLRVPRFGERLFFALTRTNRPVWRGEMPYSDGEISRRMKRYGRWP